MLEKFRTYQLAKQFYLDCEQVKCHRHAKEQLMRAALSVVNNLAEGSAKSSPYDRAKFYQIALASFRESQAILDVLGKTEIFKKSDHLGASLFKLQKFTVSG